MGVGLLKYLLRAKADSSLAAAFEPMPGASLVIKAANRGHREAVTLLLEGKYGFSVHDKDKIQQRTVLHHALDFPHVAEYIVARRADVEAHQHKVHNQQPASVSLPPGTAEQQPRP